MIEQALNQLDRRILNSLLFLEKFEAPKDFLTLPAPDRAWYKNKFQSESVAPSMTNFWVWFGAYATPGPHPRFSNAPLTRILYDALNLQPALTPGQRLRGSTGAPKWDVNPFKLSAGRERTKIIPQLPPALTQTQSGLRIGIDMPTHLQTEIDDYYLPEVTDTRPTMTQMLLDQGYQLADIEQALSLHPKFKDL